MSSACALQHLGDAGGLTGPYPHVEQAAFKSMITNVLVVHSERCKLAERLTSTLNIAPHGPATAQLHIRASKQFVMGIVS